MYSVLIIDDEPWTLLALKKMFQWELYGFSLIGETTDSEEAKSMIVNLCPTVVFTDINMPDVSGLQLIQFARERNIFSEFVLISGYDNFKYAQTAISLGVFSYLLKPLSQSDADELLYKLKTSLDLKNGISQNDEDYKNIGNKTFKKMLNYIDKNYMEKLSLKEVASLFNLNPSYCCQLFNKNFMCSYSDYITKLRLNKASELLLKNEMSIQEIADYLNFDYTYFTKLFKKVNGVTPHQYKKGIRTP